MGVIVQFGDLILSINDQTIANDSDIKAVSFVCAD